MPGVLGFWLIALTWFPANLSALIVPPRWRAIPHTSRATLADVAPCRRAKGRTLSEDIS